MLKTYRRNRRSFTQKGAVRSVLRETNGCWRREHLLRIDSTRTHWILVFKKRARKPLRVDLTQPGWSLLAEAVVASAFKVLAKHEPDEAEYQQAVTFILDDDSPWHQLMNLDRDICEKLLTQIHEGRKVNVRSPHHHRAGRKNGMP